MKKPDTDFEIILDPDSPYTQKIATPKNPRLKYNINEFGGRFGDLHSRLKELIKIYPGGIPKSKIIKSLIDASEIEADNFLIEVGQPNEFINLALMPPLNPVVALALISKIEIEAKEKQNKKQSDIAKRKRPGGQHPKKLTVWEQWNKWQENKKLFKNTPAFVTEMLAKTGINRPNTIRDWIKEFKSQRTG